MEKLHHRADEERTWFDTASKPRCHGGWDIWYDQFLHSTTWGLLWDAHRAEESESQVDGALCHRVWGDWTEEPSTRSQAHHSHCCSPCSAGCPLFSGAGLQRRLWWDVSDPEILAVCGLDIACFLCTLVSSPRKYNDSTALIKACVVIDCGDMELRAWSSELSFSLPYCCFFLQINLFHLFICLVFYFISICSVLPTSTRGSLTMRSWVAWNSFYRHHCDLKLTLPTHMRLRRYDSQ